ncbi:MAG: hypothetical protein KI793_06270 [Rivularia sp. (in: Bacteria)]|nr:hypothetical protein [Rivularia sp. MS3]
MKKIERQPSSLHLYEQYRPLMKTGDVIAFDGNSGFSKFIKLFTHSPYSHTAIILRDDSALFGETLLLIESSTQLKMSDATGNEAMKGVQMHFLGQRLSMFEGSAFWLPLKNPIPQQQQEKMLAWLRHIYAEKVSYTYVRVWGIPLAKIEDACGIKLKLDYSKLFCSELVTRALQVAEVIDDSIDPASQTPANVAHFKCFEKPIQIV